VLLSRVVAQFGSGMGVPPMNHAQDARATLELHHYPEPRLLSPGPTRRDTEPENLLKLRRSAIPEDTDHTSLRQS
jgi:hypothetical protein